MQKNRIIITFLLLLQFGFFQILAQDTPIAEVNSPNGNIKVELFSTKDSLFYKAKYNNQTVIAGSKLGFTASSGIFLKNFQHNGNAINSIDETYNLPVGKKSTYQNKCNELVASFSRLGTPVDVIFRVYDDGIAFRYQIISGGSTINIKSEASTVVIKDHDTSWIQRWGKSYEHHYDKRTNWNSFLTVENGPQFGAPILSKNKDGVYFLITEAANYGTYATSKLMANTQPGSFSYAPVGEVFSESPLLTPWRTIMMGELPTIVESVMVNNLNPPTEQEDISWIKPGRSTWDWGGEDAQNTVGFDIAKKYIDYSSKMGWEYFLLDDGWESDRADYTLKQMGDYAKSKSVGLLVWAHNNRFQNNKDHIRSVLQEWKDAGAVGFKADFFEDDSQEMMKKYDNIMEVAAELQMLVNFHGCTKPSGTQRRWPNLLTSEAVVGNEFYWAWPHMCPPDHNINVTFTRNVIGSMDYTPGKFASKTGKVLVFGSWAQQLALLIAYESALQCMTDNPRNFENQLIETFIQRIPSTWDDIKCLEALPDEYTTIARRNGNDWYVAALCNQERTLKLDLNFLDPSTTYYAYIYKDGDCLSEIAFEYGNALKSTDLIEIPMIKGGGAAIHLSTNPKLPTPHVKKYEAESRDNKSFGMKATDEHNICSGGVYMTKLGKGIYLRFQKIEVEEDGQYAMNVYYMANEDRNSYIKINNGEELFYNFVSTEGTDGKSLGYQTIIVDLKKGENIIEFGNKQELIPNIDRISIKTLVDPIPDEVSIQESKSESSIQISTSGKNLNIETLFDGISTIYTLGGKVLKKNQLYAGKNTIAIDSSGVYIVNVLCGIESVSQKIIIS